MGLVAYLGAATEILGLAATSIGAGIVVGGFLVACAGIVTGRSRKEIESNALRDAFLGSLAEFFVCCLIYYGDTVLTMAAKNIYISVLAFICILFPGGALFRHSQGLMFLVEFAAFVVMFALLHALDDRDRRHRQPED